MLRGRTFRALATVVGAAIMIVWGLAIHHKDDVLLGSSHPLHRYLQTVSHVPSYYYYNYGNQVTKQTPLQNGYGTVPQQQQQQQPLHQQQQQQQPMHQQQRMEKAIPYQQWKQLQETTPQEDTKDVIHGVGFVQDHQASHNAPLGEKPQTNGSWKSPQGAAPLHSHDMKTSNNNPDPTTKNHNDRTVMRDPSGMVQQKQAHPKETFAFPQKPIMNSNHPDHQIIHDPFGVLQQQPQGNPQRPATATSPKQEPQTLGFFQTQQQQQQQEATKMTGPTALSRNDPVLRTGGTPGLDEQLPISAQGASITGLPISFPQEKPHQGQVPLQQNKQQQTLLTQQQALLTQQQQGNSGATEYEQRQMLRAPSKTTASHQTTNQVSGPWLNFQEPWGVFDRKTELPIIWLIPKSGASAIVSLLRSCYHRIVWNLGENGVMQEVPPQQQQQQQQQTQVARSLHIPKETGHPQQPYPDVVATLLMNNAHKALEVGGSSRAKGRLFSVFRHPVERAIDMFFYLREATWEPTYQPEWQTWTLDEYAKSNLVESNWMTRQLCNKPSGPLQDEDLHMAMEIVRSRILVGLVSRLEETMSRFEKYFGWKYRIHPDKQESCRFRLVDLYNGSKEGSSVEKGGPKGSHDVKTPATKSNMAPSEGIGDTRSWLKEGDPAWELLASKNTFDTKLYEYAEMLFNEQEVFVAGVPDIFRFIDCTCCQCAPPSYPQDGEPIVCPNKV